MVPENADSIARLQEVIADVLSRSRRHPLSHERLMKEIARALESQKEQRIVSVLERLAKEKLVLIFGEGRRAEYFWAPNLEQLEDRLRAVVRAHHTKHPYEAGIRASEIRKGFSETQTMNLQKNVDARLFGLALSRCRESGGVVETEGGYRLSDFAPRTRGDAEILALEESILRYVRERAFQRVDVQKMAGSLAADVRMIKAVVAGMLGAIRLVEVEDGRYFEPAEIERLQRDVERALGGGARLHLTEIAAALGRSRTAIRPVVDYLDRIGVTRRIGDERELIRGGGQ